MARIRSVHPSLFTDEAWVSCSPLARLLYVGLWTDADDQGLFEWKPLQIKMRLLAGDTADAGALLAELVGVDLIASFETAGKRYGAIRNFRQFQRPKKPNAIHPLPPEWRDYVALGSGDDEPDPDDTGDAPTGTEPVPHQSGTSGEKSPQMEDGGGRGGDKRNHTERGCVIDKPFLEGLEAKLRKAAGPSINSASPALMIVAPILGLLRPGDGPACDLDADVLPALRAAAAKARPGAAKTWGYFVPAIIEARDRRLSGAGPMALASRAKPEDWPESRWAAAVRIFTEDGRWSETCGPEPGKPGCRVPVNVLIANGFGGEGTVVPFEPRTDRSAA